MRAAQRFVVWTTELHPFARVGVYAGLGALAALGQAPLNIWPATIIALAALFALFRQSERWRGALWLGWAAGAGYFMLALNWIVEPFLVDVARHGWMAPFALVFLSIGLGVFWAAAFAVSRAIGGGVAAWVASFVIAEALRGAILTGFPWAQIGHVWINTPMLYWSSWGGSLLLSVFCLSAALGLWRLLSGHRKSGAAVVMAFAMLYVGGGALSISTAAKTSPIGAPMVRLVQPNAAQHEKWDPEKVQTFFDRQINFTRAESSPRPDLVVWPETAIPVLLNNAEGTLKAISRAASGAPVVLGLRRVEGARLFNSMVALDANGDVSALYDKHHLVPFGEYVPMGDVLSQFGIRGMASRDGDGYSPGPGATLIDLGDLGRALPLICYEGVFPQDVLAAPERADFMLLITNDAWFGQVSGPYQHLAQARLRSAEQGLPMIRVANTGVSAVIDGTGRITGSLPLGEAGWIDLRLPPPLPPTFYARTGDWPVLAAMALLLGVSLANRRKRKAYSD